MFHIDSLKQEYKYIGNLMRCIIIFILAIMSLACISFSMYVSGFFKVFISLIFFLIPVSNSSRAYAIWQRIELHVINVEVTYLQSQPSFSS